MYSLFLFGIDIGDFISRLAQIRQDLETIMKFEQRKSWQFLYEKLGRIALKFEMPISLGGLNRENEN